MQALCPQCKIPLPYPEDTEGQFTCYCGRVVPYKSGIYLFVDKDDFYEGRFTTTIGATGLKKILKNVLNYLSIDGNEARFYRRATGVIRKELDNKPMEILNIGAGGGAHIPCRDGHRYLSRYFSIKFDWRQKRLQGLLSGRLHKSAFR